MSLKNLSVKIKIPRVLKNKLKNKKISQIYKKFAKSVSINESFIVAVSGGPDSLALAFLSKIYSIQKNLKVKFYIIDHKLRSESADEARYVKKILWFRICNPFCLKPSKNICFWQFAFFG